VNGDRVADVIVGAPGKNGGAGQVYVYNGRRGQPLSTIASHILTQPNLLGGLAEAGDNFGASIDVKDINNDSFADVVIGAPGEDNSAGIAHITFGSSAGVTSNVRILQQGFSGIAGTREAGDRFGVGVAIGNFDGSGTAEIAVSAPSESFGSNVGAGLVNVIPSASINAFSLSAIESTKAGTNSSDILRGTAANGIINGKGGDDRIFTGAGNDIAMGGAGDDILLAGAGDDLLYGGAGRDTQTGGRGRDVFVLTAQEGTDLIRDFRVGEDFLGLAGLEFEDLELIRQGSSTVVQPGSNQLAILTGVKPSSLTSNDFVQIGFTTFENMTVPIVVS
jgi:Ca2+-binding RTX toxin-like protein